ncbi:hypothetical protein EMIHUDRAFT_351597 [Emiliania huxleyi CCMP1516]|uniref:Uncharacterized protein n=2 Tax=Emiliania huxleyi TaxID=2903 RepID=A0A0D3KQG7_EMIH1|nr:hypothetical protein EMIHUDRAFT_351597 [Emiliania huxleyi CCMP1516]EOD38002.1 hypothetical protein EMIHUDRAFT_351597 [Emiliania huxleyi CCMP1516]|eukprot:XP_005790431.1 hypothetical protein EMIHUDRAFT_351597 [Emiliania huxleyi CCMP1516]
MAASCCGSLLASCCGALACKACGCACITTSRAASVAYILLLSLFVLCALAFGSGGGDIVLFGSGYNSTAEGWLEHMKEQAMSSASSSAESFWNDRFWCNRGTRTGGSSAAPTRLLHLPLLLCAMALLTCGTTKFGARAHRGFWIAKICLLLSLLVTTLFLDNSVLQGYREFARYASFAFLLLQALPISPPGSSMTRKSLLAIGSSECPAQQTIISLTLIACVVLSVLSCSKIAPHGTLLTSAAVTAYATFLCYSALASHPDDGCNPFSHRRHSALDIVVGLLVALAGTAWNATSTKNQVIGSDSASPNEQPLDPNAEKEAPAYDEMEEESWWYYHLMMATCALYLSMLLTGWSTEPAYIDGVPTAVGTIDTYDAASYSVGLPSFWVKVVSQWICLLLYSWTLLAPYLLRDHRDFGIEFDF